MSETIELQGRAWQACELEQIRQWVEQNPTWSRYRLSRELCVGWNWVRPNGQLADMAARSFLNKLHERALIQLPPCWRASPNTPIIEEKCADCRRRLRFCRFLNPPCRFDAGQG